MSTLISDKDELKANFGAIDANFTWESIKSFVEDVERDIIAETIGDEALAYFAGNPTLNTGVFQKVLAVLKRAEAYLTILKWSQTALYRLTDKSLYIAKNSDGVVISDKKLRDLRNYCEETGFNHLDKAIGLMEANLEQFVAYADSGVRQSLMQGFIKTAADFHLQRSINNSRITFMSMSAIMLDVEAEYLPATMGKAFYEVYKERYLDDELTSNEKKLLPLIKKAVAFLTVGKACSELPIKVTDKGLLINRYNDTKEYDQADPASAARIHFLQDDTLEKGRRKLQELYNELVANANLYPGFIAPATETHTPNDCDSGVFIM